MLALMVAVHAWCFLYAVRHYAVGHDGPADPRDFLFDPAWSPPLVPAAAWAVAYTGSLAALAALLWRAVTRPAAAPGPDTVGASRRATAPVTEVVQA